MGDPDLKAKRSYKRKRNILAKEMWEKTKSIKKVHTSEKDREKQRKWRLEQDRDGDYDNLDDFLLRGRNNAKEET